MKRTIFCIASLSLLAVCLTSCGSTDNVRTIQLTTPSTDLQGIGATTQLQVQGTYAYGPNRDLTNEVTYTMIVDPNSQIALPTPPNTITVSSTGLVTAVEPAVCTFNDVGTDHRARLGTDWGLRNYGHLPWRHFAAHLYGRSFGRGPIRSASQRCNAALRLQRTNRSFSATS